MKHVLHLSSWYPNNNDPQDGDFIQRHLQAISLFQQVNVIFVTRENRQTARIEKEMINSHSQLSEKVVYYHPFQTKIGFIDRIISAFRYKQVFKKQIIKYMRHHGKPDLVHVHVAMRAGLLALWMKKKFRIPYIVSEHWTGYLKEELNGYSAKGWLYNRWLKKILADASLVLPVSKLLLDAMRPICGHERFKIVPEVVNEKYFNYQPLNEHTLFRFIHVSSMNYQKNPQGLLLAFDELANKYPQVELVCLGSVSAQLLDWIKQNISEKGRSKLILKGIVSYEEVALQLKQSHAFVLFSRFETFCCAAIEALCCGLPVISTPVGVLSEIIDDKNGIIVESANKGELVAAFIEVINKYSSYDPKHISGQAVEKFNFKSVGKRFISIYDSFS